MKDIVIIGPSASGKSTLARQLAINLDLPHFCLDDYSIKDADSVYVMGIDGEPYKTWERPFMYDGRRMARDAMFFQPKLWCIYEGFLALHYSDIDNLPGLRIYVDVPFKECLRRRNLRPRHEDSDKAFIAIGEQETKEFVEPQKYMKDVHILDGLLPMNQLVEQATALYNRK